MIGMLEILESPWTYAAVLLVFGFFPPLVIRLIVRIYPLGHVRRRELVGEMMYVPRVARPLWLAEQLGLAVTEGVPARMGWYIVASAYIEWSLLVRRLMLIPVFGSAAWYFASQQLPYTAIFFGAFGGVGLISSINILRRGLLIVRRRRRIVAEILNSLSFNADDDLGS